MAYLLFSHTMSYSLYKEHENCSCPESAESSLDPHKLRRLFQMHFNITSTSVPTSSKGFPSVTFFPTKILHAFLTSSRVIHLSFILLSLIFYYLSATSAALCSAQQFILSFFFPADEIINNYVH